MKRLLSLILALVMLAPTAALADPPYGSVYMYGGASAGEVWSQAPVFQVGNGTGTMNPEGMTSGQYSAAGVGNGADTTDDTLFTYTLPANSLNSNGKTLVINCFGHTASNGNNKTVKLWFGSEVVSSAVITDNNKNWVATMQVGRTGASTQQVLGQLLHDTANVTAYSATGAETDTAGIVIKCTGASGTTGAASDVLGYGMSVEIMQ